LLTLLKNARVFAPEPLGRRDLLVGGERVLAIGEALDLPLPSIDLGGASLVPGFIDAHVHLTGGGGESGPASRVPPLSLGALTSAGITSAVGVLGTDGTTRSVEGLVAQTLGLREEGLSAWCWTGSYELPLLTLTGSVRRDITFVDPILGVGELAISDHRSSQPTFEEIARVAADCHVAGLLSGKAGILHLHLGDGARGLELVRRALETTELPARTFHPTHVNRKKSLFDEALDLARRGVTIDVTAFPVDDGEDAWSAEDAVERYLASGAPEGRITCSSDGGGCLPTYEDGILVKMDVGRASAIAKTFASLVDRGHPIERVLPIFTTNVASLLRLPRKGKIAVGADADLVVLDERHRIRDVMARGRFVVRDGRPTVRGMFEE
jgi:beta-aspartyl-dipeptidase (metallo-type)